VNVTKTCISLCHHTVRRRKRKHKKYKHIYNLLLRARIKTCGFKTFFPFLSVHTNETHISRFRRCRNHRNINRINNMNCLCSPFTTTFRKNNAKEFDDTKYMKYEWCGRTVKRDDAMIYRGSIPYPRLRYPDLVTRCTPRL